MTEPPTVSISRFDRISAIVAILFTLALLALAIWPLSSADAPETTKFFGRFHSILVHLPIGFLLALLVLESLDLLIKSVILHHATYVMAWLAAGAALLAVAAGILLAYPGQYSEELLFWHRWLGILTAICAIWILAWKIGRSPQARHGWSFAYHPLLLLTAGLLTGAGHYGGSLTHGSDYLTVYMPDALRPWFNVEARQPLSRPDPDGDPRDAVVFTALVQPILRTSCVNCHGTERQRGGLRLDTHDYLIRGGESGPDVRLIAQSLHLPLDDKQRMPPKERPQLSLDEVALLTWWVETGASEEARVSDLPVTGQMERVLERAGFGPKVYQVPMEEWELVAPLVLELSSELGVNIRRVARDTSALEIPFLPMDVTFGDEELARLLLIGPNLEALNLRQSTVSDGGLESLAEMENLRRLNLSNTGISDAGLAHLSNLRRLEYLNLFGTPVTDEGLRHLERLSNLRRIYLWQTAVTPVGAGQLKAGLIDDTQVTAWRAEIRKLEERLAASTVAIDLGAADLPSEEPAPDEEEELAPDEERCPITGQLADPRQTAVHGERVIAFCCENCLARFEKDPDPILAKLGLVEIPE